MIKFHEKDKVLAFRFAVSLALHMIHAGQYATAEPWERVFILLTLRHSPTEGLKSLALRKCLLEAEADPSALWCRFLNATVWDVHCWREKTVGYPAEAPADSDSLQTFSRLLEPPRTWNSHTCIELLRAFETSLKSVESRRVAVSISGGVDSMVAAWIANDVCKQLGKELILLHVNYGNREECEDECNLLRWYSQRLGVPLYIRHITEIRRIRNSGLRTVYEEVTRRIRFAFYKAFACPVILGHNLDDCYENVFSNLSKQIHMENLFGMSTMSHEMGVQIIRPMLEIAKIDILRFADTREIPHLYDSTPSWSRRGQMRDQLIPGIQAFDAGILEGLRVAVERMRFLENQWAMQFQQWYTGLTQTSNTVTLMRDTFFQTNSGDMQFWIRLFQTLGREWPRPSNKSIHNLIQMLGRTEGCCNLNKTVKMFLQPQQIILHATDLK